MKNTLFSFSLILLSQGTALAHDSSHFVCTGYFGEGGDRYGFAIQFDESRAPGGVDRNEMLSAVWAGNLYQGVHLNTGDVMGENAHIVLANQANPDQVFFEGDYHLIRTTSDDSRYDLEISGNINDSPLSSTAVTIPVSTVLSCIDIST